MDIFQFKIFSSQKNIKQGISTREVGSIKNEDGSINKNNLEKFFNSLQLPVDKAVKMKQVHSADVVVVDSDYKNLEKEADGMITQNKNIPLYVLTADCLPLLFFDPKKQVIGVAHGGRRGLQNKIIENMIEGFVSEFGSNSKDIIVGIGPGIEKTCYEVDGELMDLKLIAKSRLMNKGVTEENIESSNICTKCSQDLYFSYRGGDKHERFATVISIS